MLHGPTPAARTSGPPNLFILGVDFRTAPAAVREQLVFDDTAVAELCASFHEKVPQAELAVLSTCNRTEFLLAVPADADGVIPTLLQLVRQARPQGPIHHQDCIRAQWANMDAALHLMRVACGLDSAVLGDTQILAQIRNAQRVAESAGTVGPADGMGGAPTLGW